jgi:hypothetical protein
MNENIGQSVDIFSNIRQPQEPLLKHKKNSFCAAILMKVFATFGLRLDRVT